MPDSFIKLVSFGQRGSAALLIGFAILAWTAANAHAQRTDPRSRDSDRDGFVDGPDMWIDLPDGKGGILTYLYVGEDKNGNGRLDREGEDGIFGTPDDETDPRDPRDHPKGERSFLDSDRDWLSDDDEIELGLDPHDDDTDDDGLRDGEEVLELSPVGRNFCNPFMPDSDMDGLPDGLELGLQSPRGSDTNLAATFTYRAPDYTEASRTCFIADLDPLSRSFPHYSDSNGDSISDGNSDLDANGRLDAGELDPVAGPYAPDSPNASPEDILDGKTISSLDQSIVVRFYWGSIPSGTSIEVTTDDSRINISVTGDTQRADQAYSEIEIALSASPGSPEIVENSYFMLRISAGSWANYPTFMVIMMLNQAAQGPTPTPTPTPMVFPIRSITYMTNESNFGSTQLPIDPPPPARLMSVFLDLVFGFSPKGSLSGIDDFDALKVAYATELSLARISSPALQDLDRFRKADRINDFYEHEFGLRFEIDSGMSPTFQTMPTGGKLAELPLWTVNEDGITPIVDYEAWNGLPASGVGPPEIRIIPSGSALVAREDVIRKFGAYRNDMISRYTNGLDPTRRRFELGLDIVVFPYWGPNVVAQTVSGGNWPEIDARRAKAIPLGIGDLPVRNNDLIVGWNTIIDNATEYVLYPEQSSGEPRDLRFASRALIHELGHYFAATHHWIDATQSASASGKNIIAPNMYAELSGPASIAVILERFSAWRTANPVHGLLVAPTALGTEPESKLLFGQASYWSDWHTAPYGTIVPGGYAVKNVTAPEELMVRPSMGMRLLNVDRMVIDLYSKDLYDALRAYGMVPFVRRGGP